MTFPPTTARISIRTLTAMLSAIVAGRLDPGDTAAALRFLLDGSEARDEGGRPREQLERVGTIMRDSGLLESGAERGRAAGARREASAPPGGRRAGKPRSAARRRRSKSRSSASASNGDTEAAPRPARRGARESLTAALENAHLL